MKPSDFYIGVMDFFAILLPGAILLSFLHSTFDLSARLGDVGVIPKGLSVTATWVVFSLSSYAAGHFVFLLASPLDRLYDPYRRMQWPDAPGNAYHAATALRSKGLGPLRANSSMNTFTWAKALLLLRAPAAAAAVQRFEADSKFFRSAVVVLALLAVGLVWKGHLGIAIVLFVLGLLAFIRYAERRYQSTQWAYQYVITYAAHGSAAPEGHDDE